MKYSFKPLCGLRRLAMPLVIALILGIVVASHTIPTVANVTSAAIQFLTGVETIASATAASKKSVQKKLDATEKELRVSKRQVAALRTENAALKKNQNVTFKGRKISARKATQETLRSIRGRTKRVAAANLASAAGESIPLYGVAVIVAATGFELTSACQNMKEIYALEQALGFDETSAADRDYVCGLRVPTREELWHTVKTSPTRAWNGAVDAYDGTKEWVSDLEAPDFSGRWTELMTWLADFF